MKLRICFISSHRYDFSLKSHYNGGGWIEGLEALLANHADIDLTVLFLSNSDIKYVRNNITYLPVKRFEYNLINRIYTRLGCFNTSKYRHYIREVLKYDLDNFDLIHIFGFECFFIESYLHLNVQPPVVLHMQGILGSVLKSYFPPSFFKSPITVFRSLLDLCFFKGSFYEYRKLLKRAKLAEVVSSKIEFYTGRTYLDYSFFSTRTKNAHYFKIQEVIRPVFFEKSYKIRSDKGLKIVSVISDNLFKGLRNIIDICEILSSCEVNFEWSVIGINEYSKTLRDMGQIVSLNLLNLKFLGTCSGKEIVEIFDSSDIYFHPSQIENSSNSVAEALVYGIPVITFDVGGMSSILKNGSYGLLIPKDETTFAAQKLLDIKVSLSNNSYDFSYLESVRREFSHQVILEKTLNMYNSILLTKNIL